MNYLKTYQSESDWVSSVLQEIGSTLGSDLHKYDRSSIALSGGGTPYPIYKALQNIPILWDKVNLVQVDERHVPPGDSEHNWTKVVASLGEDFISRVHSVCKFTYAQSQEQMCEDIDHCIPEQLGLTILGMGEDGHFASLFPQGDYWKISNTKSVISTQAPSTYVTQERLSLSPEYIKHSKKILVLLRGSSKAEAIDMLMDQGLSIEEFPILYLMDHPNLEIHWLND